MLDTFPWRVRCNKESVFKNRLTQELMQIMSKFIKAKELLLWMWPEKKRWSYFICLIHCSFKMTPPPHPHTHTKTLIGFYYGLNIIWCLKVSELFLLAFYSSFCCATLTTCLSGSLPWAWDPIDGSGHLSGYLVLTADNIWFPHMGLMYARISGVMCVNFLKANIIKWINKNGT